MRWTHEELSLLEKIYTTNSNKDLLEHFPNRTKAAIKAKALEMGLKKNSETYSVTPWTAEETLLFIEMYGKHTNEELIKYFPNRTKTSLTLKARELGVKKNLNFHNDNGLDVYWSDEEQGLLLKVYSNHTEEGTLKYFPDKTKLGVKVKALELGLKKDPKSYPYSKATPYWSNAEEELLKELHPKLSIDELVLHFPHRTKNAILNRVSRLGISKKPTSFTGKEVKTLIKWGSTASIDELMGKLPDKTKAQILYRIKVLGIDRHEAKRKEYTSKNAWTVEEQRLLKENYFSTSTTELLRLLPNKKKAAIMYKATVLGLKTKKS